MLFAKGSRVLTTFRGARSFDDMGLSRNGDTPKTGWFLLGKIPEMDDDWGYYHDSGNAHMAGSFTSHLWV